MRDRILSQPTQTMANLSFVTISKPCNESFDKMEATERGHFCHRCQKEVIDLTHKSHDELVAYKAASPAPICAAISADAAGLSHPIMHNNAWLRQLRRFFMACLIVLAVACLCCLARPSVNSWKW